jgi:hypothetical protein
MRWLETARAVSNQREICFSPRTHGRSSLMKFALLLIAALSCCAVACKRSEKVLTVKTATLERKIPLSELITTFGASEVTVDDYYLKRRVTYRALPLAKMLARFAAEFSAYDEFIFRCADGYLAHVSRADFEAGKLDSFALAFGEGSEVFRSKIPQGKAELSPEPFYAVATDPAGFQTLSWPYEVIAIELVNFRAMFPALYFEGHAKRHFSCRRVFAFQKRMPEVPFTQPAGWRHRARTQRTAERDPIPRCSDAEEIYSQRFAVSCTVKDATV